MSDLLAGQRWNVLQGDCLELLRTLPDGCVSLVMGSPPYEAQRTYGIDFKLRGQAWVDWFVERWAEFDRVCTGAVCMVVEGFTHKFQWSATPALLMADLHRKGFKLRKPPIYHRVGIPGSGGPDWLRNDWEFVVCTSSGRLPWSDNTAMGHAPKWAPGGAMSHRLSDGTRVNQWGTAVSDDGKVSKGGQNGATGERAGRVPLRPSHKVSTIGSKGNRKDNRIADQGRDSNDQQSYDPPAIANPGNVIHCKVGGGLMGGDAFSSLNEAPYPERLAEFFVRSFCPPDGIVLDPFSGSGTTGAVAVRNGRRFIGYDIRQSQVDLSRRRLEGETPVFREMA